MNLHLPEGYVKCGLNDCGLYDDLKIVIQQENLIVFEK